MISCRPRLVWSDWVALGSKEEAMGWAVEIAGAVAAHGRVELKATLGRPSADLPYYVYTPYTIPHP